MSKPTLNAAANVPLHESGEQDKSMRFVRRICFLLSLHWLVACSTIVATPAPDEPAQSSAQAVSAWSRILNDYVNERGEVDFAKLRSNRADLDRYVFFVAKTPLEAFDTRDEQLAHLINSYNALSMFNVIESGIPETHAGLAKLRFFVLRKLTIAQQQRSLYSYENDIIRPLGEPRIHFALNCSAASCPVLPRQAFDATRLDSQLDREARAFFARPENFRVDDSSRTVWLSEILKFYSEDFVPDAAPNLIAYANKYAKVPAPTDYVVKFTTYDWTVANSKRKQ